MFKIVSLVCCGLVIVVLSVVICLSMDIITYDVTGSSSNGEEVYGEIKSTDDVTVLNGWVEYRDGRRDNVVGIWTGMGMMEVASNSTYIRYILYVEE